MMRMHDVIQRMQYDDLMTQSHESYRKPQSYLFIVPTCFDAF